MRLRRKATALAVAAACFGMFAEASAGTGQVATAASTPTIATTTTVTIDNFTTNGAQAVKFDTAGNAIDAHEGGIELFGGTYYLYGESHGCGVMWQQGGTAWCGIGIYSSPDLVHWTNLGLAFAPDSYDGLTHINGRANTWQDDCNGATWGCYRPHVVYNASTGKYVMWINGNGDNVSNYWVLTASSPAGPFTIATASPTLAYTGQNLGDEEIFVDSDGTAYIDYTDWSINDQVVEKLNASYTSGVGTAFGNAPSANVVRLGQSYTEAPAMFLRNGSYYLTFSDPNCGYCYDNGGASYRQASSPLGPWGARTVLSDVRDPVSAGGKACQGQPTNVLPVPLADGSVTYLFQSDLNTPTAQNEAPANYYWGPLQFNTDGSIRKLECLPTVTLTLASAGGSQLPVTDIDQTSGVTGFTNKCDIGSRLGGTQRLQTFIPSRSGTLTSVGLTVYQRYSGTPLTTMVNQPLVVDLVALDTAGKPTTVLGSATATPTPKGAIRPSQNDVTWGLGVVTFGFSAAVTGDTAYGFVVRSNSTLGCYGFAFSDTGTAYPAGTERVSTDSGATWTTEPNRALKFYTTMAAAPAGIAPAFTSAPNLNSYRYVPFSSTLQASGSPAPTFQVTGGSLPIGLSLDPATGVISGTATGLTDQQVQVTASNGVGQPAVATFTIGVGWAPFLADSPATAGVVGGVFDSMAQFTSSPIAAVSVSSGSWPPGLVLGTPTYDPAKFRTTVTIKGTPTKAGTFTFSLRAVLASGGPAETDTFTITVS